MTYDLIIIGGGPAGVSAGIYASRKKINYLLLTKDFGGQSTSSASIENFIGFESISGYDLAKNLEDHLRAQENVKIKDGIFVTKVVKNSQNIFEVEDSSGEKHLSKTVLVTLGSNYRKLGVPGEKEYSGKGVFYCSICDAPLMKEKSVAVVGGGNSGLEAVIDLIPYADKIYLLEYAENLKGDQIYQDQISKEPKVQIITSVQTKEIIGSQFVSGLKYLNLKTSKEETLDVSGVFVQIGYEPNTGLIKDLVKLDQRGQVVVDHKTYKTSCEGLWAAGDMTDALYNQINTAMGDSIKALLNIYDYLKTSK